jgi:hypothetical protein
VTSGINQEHPVLDRLLAERPDRRAGDLAAGSHVGDRRADHDRVLVRDRAVVVVADGQARVQRARGGRIRAHGDDPELHLAMARRNALEHRDLVATARDRLEHEREDERPILGQLAHVQDLRTAHLARRLRPRSTLIGLRGDVRVTPPATRRGRERHRERRQLIARL